MKTNANGTIEKSSVENRTRVRVGDPNYKLDPNLDLAVKTVKVGQVAVLPDGSEWLRIDARKNDGEALILIQ